MQTHKIKFIYIICMLICLSCGHKIEQDKSEVNLSSAPNPILKRDIDSLSKTFDVDTLKIVVAKLDSVLLDKENGKIGYYFYKRGYCFSVLKLFEKAILDLKTARKLNYLPDKCTELINYNEDLLAIEEEFN